jgi:hypothetical protein
MTSLTDLLGGAELLVLTALVLTLAYYVVVLASTQKDQRETRGGRGAWLGPATVGLYYLIRPDLYDERGNRYRRRLIWGLVALAAVASLHLVGLPIPGP